jgi:catechol-2,3-dioxygenase
MLPDVYVDHLVFRVQNLDTTETVYRALFGEAISRGEDSLLFQAGETKLFFTASTRKLSGPYDKEQPGLNHLAFGVHEPSLLRKILDHLNTSGLQHSEIQIDSYGDKEFIWLDDPDGFRLEFYCRPGKD